jgi:hypothetical protein
MITVSQGLGAALLKGVTAATDTDLSEGAVSPDVRDAVTGEFTS